VRLYWRFPCLGGREATLSPASFRGVNLSLLCTRFLTVPLLSVSLFAASIKPRVVSTSLVRSIRTAQFNTQRPLKLTHDMERFEDLLSQATKKGANGVPGAAAAVVDRSGTFTCFTPLQGYEKKACERNEHLFSSTESWIDHLL